MDLLAPSLLSLLVIIPLLIVFYLWMLRRKRRFAVRYSSLAIVREALPKRARLRRHLPFALFLIGMSALILAMAKPVAQVEMPLNRTTIILALDVSRSMCATDILPNRLTVAQDSALAFIDEQDAGTQIGIVAFAGLAEIIVPPTTDKDTLKDAINNLTTSLGTAIGSATLKSIDAIAEINPNVAPSGLNLSGLAGEAAAQEQAEIAYQPEIIVLLTDGANTRGPFPLDAAMQAADRRIRVYTIGFGTTQVSEMVCSRQQLGSQAFEEDFGRGFGFFGGFGGFGGGDPRRFLLLDEPTLQGVADMTGGEYFRAENADQLLEVFLELPKQVILQKENFEVSVVLLAIGGIFIFTASLLSMKWNRFP